MLTETVHSEGEAGLPAHVNFHNVYLNDFYEYKTNKIWIYLGDSYL
jgi:hypothetical protein